MKVDTDPATGTIRLDEAAFDTLVRAEAKQCPALPEHDAALRVPGVREALRAAHRPLMQAQLDVAGRRGRQRHWFWLDRGAVAALLAVSEDVRQLVPSTPEQFPGVLARITRLGPGDGRTLLGRTVTANVVENLFHADEMRRISGLDLTGADRAWTLCMTWCTGERQVAVVDGPAGPSFLLPTDGDANGSWWLKPTTPTMLWRALTILLPSGQQLAEVT